MKEYQKPELYEVCLPSTPVLFSSEVDVEFDMGE